MHGMVNFEGHDMFFPSVLTACNQDIICLLSKPPGKMTTWFHQPLSWMLRWEWKNFGRSGTELSPVDFQDMTLQFWSLLYLDLRVWVCLRERDMFACVQQTDSFNSPISISIMAEAAIASQLQWMWIACSNTSAGEQLGWVLLGWMLPQCQCRHLQVPSGCPCTGKHWLQGRQGTKTELEVMSIFTEKGVLLWGHQGGQQRGSSTFRLCCSYIFSGPSPSTATQGVWDYAKAVFMKKQKYLDQGQPSQSRHHRMTPKDHSILTEDMTYLLYSYTPLQHSSPEVRLRIRSP